VKFLVCVKQVPDSWAEKKLAADTRLDRAGVDAVLNDLDEYAIEETLRIAEASGGNGEGGAHTITLLSMGPDRAAEAIRKGLSMGADDAIHISDPAISGSDALATSLVLAKAIEKQVATTGVDVVFCGTESTDARMSVVPAMLAERLGWPQLTFALEVKIENGKARIKRSTDDGIEEFEAPLPCVISVNEKINEPRYPSFKGIMAAKKKAVVNQNLSDLGIATSEVGEAAAWTKVNDFALRPARSAGIKIVDEGNGGNELVSFLAEKKLV